MIYYMLYVDILSSTLRSEQDGGHFAEGIYVFSEENVSVQFRISLQFTPSSQ